MGSVEPDLAGIAGPAAPWPYTVGAVLLAVLALIFWYAQQPAGKRLFGIVPRLVFCYFVPTTLTTLGILPAVVALGPDSVGSGGRCRRKPTR